MYVNKYSNCECFLLFFFFSKIQTKVCDACVRLLFNTKLGLKLLFTFFFSTLLFCPNLGVSYEFSKPYVLLLLGFWIMIVATNSYIFFVYCCCYLTWLLFITIFGVTFMFFHFSVYHYLFINVVIVMIAWLVVLCYYCCFCYNFIFIIKV